MSLLTELQRLRLDAHEFYGEQLIDRVIGLAADSLDAAWVEAEAALPKGCHLVLRGRSAGPRRSSDEIPTIGYRAAAFCGSRDIGPFADWWDTPVAALRALIVKLRDHGKTVIPTTEDITPDESRGERLMVGDELLPPGTVGRRPR
jgi:hypothetical protein